jgi:Nuclear transport factor 2 (NTF2) domain
MTFVASCCHRVHPCGKFTQAFTDHYYNTFDTNRPALATLYQDQSMMTFEGEKFAGAAITQKLTSLPFQQCQHRVVSLDAQPSVSQGINIFVTGQLIVSLPEPCKCILAAAVCLSCAHVLREVDTTSLLHRRRASHSH